MVPCGGELLKCPALSDAISVRTASSSRISDWIGLPAQETTLCLVIRRSFDEEGGKIAWSLYLCISSLDSLLYLCARSTKYLCVLALDSCE
jgi:hypothetical protein